MFGWDRAKLSELMARAGIDLLLVNSRHNLRYLTGYYFHFYERTTRFADSQYLPLLGLPRGDFNRAFYVGRHGEEGQQQAEGLWVVDRYATPAGTVAAAEKAAEVAAKRGYRNATIGVEFGFLPADAFAALRRGLPGATFVDASPVLTELRAVKTRAEIDHLRSVHDRTAQAIVAAFRVGRPGITTREVARQVELEMTARDLVFLWAFTAAGPGMLRAPAAVRWEEGQVLHIDAGGEDKDYLADICRMGSLGEPPPLAQELHSACLEVQDRVRRAIRPGLPANELLRLGQEAVAALPFRAYGRFVAHGIGMVSHEEPRINPDNPRPLEAGMVLSVETEFRHPEVGHVKIEDAVVLTPAGCEGLGDLGREWQIVGGANGQ
ncbi:MAG: hypothetical protein C4316_05915 [Chloroflexota bacterium]